MVPFERAKVVSYRLSVGTITLNIWPQFSVEYVRRSKSNQQKVGHFGAKFGRKGLTVVSQILTQSGKERHEAVVSLCKRNLLAFEHNARM